MANDAQSAAALHRYEAAMRFNAGDAVAGRAAYEQAAKVFEKFPEKNRNVVNVAQAQTQQNWAERELSLGECDAAWRHITLAQDYRAYVSLVAETAKNIEAQCGPKDAS